MRMDEVIARRPLAQHQAVPVGTQRSGSSSSHPGSCSTAPASHVTVPLAQRIRALPSPGQGHWLHWLNFSSRRESVQNAKATLQFQETPEPCPLSRKSTAQLSPDVRSS